ncbi:serine-type peptidase [Niveomyces insectorum RCEF 264]|uniref:Serine-type peptidase n=1 Tax=Niveomyces insectorum RCEF 264 TaxID=1081102 RepID=A0A167PRI3_9HYPO|nr:serine-type peptidase [Niveomyces insectorum RCEF 264]
MLDMTYFASNVTFDLGGDLGPADNAAAAPWVLVGGSYAGALAAWIQQKAPGVFYAYHASSAVVETITDFYTYFFPIRDALPANCSADVRAVVQHVDTVLTGGDPAAVAALKAPFGLAYLTHDDDFAVQISWPLRQWQDDPATVYAFCDYLEGDPRCRGGRRRLLGRPADGLRHARRRRRVRRPDRRRRRPPVGLAVLPQPVWVVAGGRARARRAGRGHQHRVGVRRRRLLCAAVPACVPGDQRVHGRARGRVHAGAPGPVHARVGRRLCAGAVCERRGGPVAVGDGVVGLPAGGPAGVDGGGARVCGAGRQPLPGAVAGGVRGGAGPVHGDAGSDGGLARGVAEPVEKGGLFMESWPVSKTSRGIFLRMDKDKTSNSSKRQQEQ